VWVRETSESEPLTTHRNSSDDIKIGDEQISQNEHREDLFIDYAVSGVEVA